MAPELPKPLTLLGIAFTTIFSGALLGAVTNAINGRVSPEYYRAILRWDDTVDVPRAAIAQGVFEGLIYGVLFALVFTLVIGAVSKARAPFTFALRHLALAMGIALLAWCLGGSLGMALATLSPDFYRNAFRGVPYEFKAMLSYAWVGGSILGVLLGALLAVMIVSTLAWVNWNRRATAI